MTHSEHPTTVHVPFDDHTLTGTLSIPEHPRGIVLFAHGSGSSRLSPRNQFVAHVLERQRLATLLIDLLTPREEEVDDMSGEYRFDISLLASRLVSIVDWLQRDARTGSLPIGLFGASTGAGAALIAAAGRPQIAAVVSRGGRPDLAGTALRRVTAPTLLIVGGLDTAVIELNRNAMGSMRCEVSLKIVPGASHLFEEPGALDRVAAMAGDWFLSHLRTAAMRSE